MLEQHRLPVVSRLAQRFLACEYARVENGWALLHYIKTYDVPTSLQSTQGPPTPPELEAWLLVCCTLQYLPFRKGDRETDTRTRCRHLRQLKCRLFEISHQN